MTIEEINERLSDLDNECEECYIKIAEHKKQMEFHGGLYNIWKQRLETLHYQANELEEIKYDLIGEEGY